MIKELSGDSRRQAVSSIRGTVYQAWCSIDSWLRIVDDSEVIYLEGAEDFDVVSVNDAITVQVRNTASPISLGTAKALTALENFWMLSCRESQRTIEYHYLTTSPIALEQDADFDGVKGIEFWRIAQTNDEFAIAIAKYLITKLGPISPLRAFLSSAPAEAIQRQLLQKFHWLTDQPDLEIVKRSVDDRITDILARQRLSTTSIPSVRKYLESRFWEIILEQNSSQRCLTHGELIRQIEAATTAYIPIPVDKIADLIGNTRPGLGLLKLLLEKTPVPPEPLLDRPLLTQQIEELLCQRKVVLLTGTVHKGKTTLAQIVSARICREAWWINLSGRKNDQVDNILLALAGEIENESCPNLIIIDDLDTSPTARRIYENSLNLVLHRAFGKGQGVLITARGETDQPSPSMGVYKNISVIEVPKLEIEEIIRLCVEHGCSREIANAWGSIIAVWTKGHPKLVQVRLSELANQNWPRPSPADLTTQSSATTSVRQMARQLLSESASEPVVEFVYLITECSVLMHRSVGLKLAEFVDGLTNGGDVLDGLTGKWLERTEGKWFQATALLKGAAADVWTESKRKWAHNCLHDAIQSKGTLDPFEAAALLFHAFMAKDPRRIAFTAAKLQVIDNEEAQREVERQLLWLPYVALEPGQNITDDAFADSSLRALQFRVSSNLDADCLPKICDRWVEASERITNLEARNLLQSMMWLSIASEFNPEVPIGFRLRGILALHESGTEEIQLDSNVSKWFFKEGAIVDGLPKTGTWIQALLLCATRSVRSLNDLSVLLSWLDTEASEEIRQQFDAMLEWPLMQSMGTFVVGAFAAVHDQTEDWHPWLGFFENADECAKRLNLTRFGREVAKTKAIILTEHLSLSKEALQALTAAEAAFGSSFVLMEQRANVLFYTKDDTSVLDLWGQLASESATKDALDPFAYRRAGISATRLNQWVKAGQIFSEGANSIKDNTFELTKFGLTVDAALAFARGGRLNSAATILADAAVELPCKASEDGQQQWDMVQRVSVEVSRIIDNAIWKQGEVDSQLASGFASSPDLTNPKVEPEQVIRHQMAKAEAFFLAILLSKNPEKYAVAMEPLAGSQYPLIRQKVIEGKLAFAISAGAGKGFISTLLEFDRFISESIHRMQLGISPTEPDSGTLEGLQFTPHRWFGFLCAAAVTAGFEIYSKLQIWLHEGTNHLGKNAEFNNLITLLMEGASLPSAKLWPAIVDVKSPGPIRCGAAVKLLQEDLPAETIFQVQCFLTSAMISGDSLTRQQLFNHSVAKCFAQAWRVQSTRSFQFYSPRTSIPALISAIDGLEGGNSTLKSVLGAASRALNQPRGEFMDHLL